MIFENSARVSLDPDDFWGELTKLDNEPARQAGLPRGLDVVVPGPGRDGRHRRGHPRRSAGPTARRTRLEGSGAAAPHGWRNFTVMSTMMSPPSRPAPTARSA